MDGGADRVQLLYKLYTDYKWNCIGLIALLVTTIIASTALVMVIVLNGDADSNAARIMPIRVRVEGANPTLPTFRVYYPSHSERKAESMANLINSRIRKIGGYSSTEVIYYLSKADRDRIIQAHKKNEKFDLLLIKPDVLKRLVLQSGYIYEKLAEYAPYDVFFVSKFEPFDWKNGNFRVKRIGLLANPTSESGYIIPMNVINKYPTLNKRIQVLNKFSSHYELRKALMKDEVDVISTYWTEHDRRKHPNWKLVKIGKVENGSAWFIEKNEEIECAIVQALMDNAINSRNKYWKNIEIIKKCDH